MFIKRSAPRIEEAEIISEKPKETPEKLAKCVRCGKPFIPICTNGEYSILCPACMTSNRV